MEIQTKPEVLRCYFDKTVQPPIPAMQLVWASDMAGAAERLWHLPGGVALKGPAPEYFGVTIERQHVNSYRLRILWNKLYLNWSQLSRLHIMACSLGPVLRALGTDLWYLLEQPINQEATHPAKVA
jgi:hypothetical protein